MTSFVVYDHPRDYPDRVVVRIWDWDQPTSNLALFPTFEAAREYIRELRPDSVRLGRFPGDDPVIAETWL